MQNKEPKREKKRGPKPKLSGGRTVCLYLDDESIDLATIAGDSNLSAGVRIVLKALRGTV